jgi:hypothetical protein
MPMSVHASDDHPIQLPSYSALGPVGSTSVAHDQARAVFGQVMGLVAATLGWLALGAYVARDLSCGIGILAASIFLDIFNVFLFLLQLFGRGRD